MEAEARVMSGVGPVNGTQDDLAEISLPQLAAIGLDGEHTRAVDSVSEFALEHRGAGIASFAADLAGLVVAAIAAAVVEVAITSGHGHKLALVGTAARLLLTVPVLAAFLAANASRWTLHSSVNHHLTATARAVFAAGLVSIAGWRLAAAAGVARVPEVDSLLLLCGFGLVTVTLARMAHHAPPVREGRRARRVIIVGSGLVANRVAEQLGTSETVDVLGFVDDDPITDTGVMGKLSELATLCEQHVVDHIVVAFSRSSSEEIIASLRPMHGRVPITVVPRLFDVLPATAAIHELGSGLTGISVAPASLGHGPRLVKRTMDVAGASAVLLVLSPLLAVVALAVKLTSAGPVFYLQERIGRNGQSFRMIKFRSMRVEASRTHPSQLQGTAVVGPFPKLKDDPRVTAVGRFIRRTSIDELPQLFNVLRGEMSLVGPRPFIPDDDAWINGWAQRRYSVRPGITGLWQVSGRNDLTFDEMCRLDSLYVSCWSIGLDVRVLLRTLRAVSARQGAY